MAPRQLHQVHAAPRRTRAGHASVPVSGGGACKLKITPLESGPLLVWPESELKQPFINRGLSLLIFCCPISISAPGQHAELQNFQTEKEKRGKRRKKRIREFAICLMRCFKIKTNASLLGWGGPWRAGPDSQPLSCHRRRCCAPASGIDSAGPTQVSAWGAQGQVARLGGARMSPSDGHRPAANRRPAAPQLFATLE